MEQLNGVFNAEDSKIVLPKTLTVSERHRMHILTRPGFYPRSKGDGENRFMEIFIKEDFFEELHDTFKSEEIEETSSEGEQDNSDINKFKRSILDDLMKIVDKYFNDIFLKHYT